MFVTPEAELRQGVGRYISVRTKQNGTIEGVLAGVSPYMSICVSNPVVNGVATDGVVRIAQHGISSITYVE